MVPTAEEFWLTKYFSKSTPEKDCQKLWLDCNPQAKESIQIMVEFAKLHVQAALKAASKQAKTKEDVAIFAEGSYRTQVVDKESILNSYPLKNIK